MARSLRSCLPLVLLAAISTGWAAPSIEAAGLMRDMAVLLIDDRQETLRVGQRSSSGVLLLAADAQRAIIELDGQRRELRLSQRVGGHFVEPVGRSVQISSDARGQFRVAGGVNGRSVTFLVDTGASLLAMSSAQAQRIGIDYRSGELGRVTTASGVTEAWFLTLDQVTVGDISVDGVRAAIVQGAFPAEALLGMSFLRHVGFAEDGGVLTLLQRF
ncbi:MAG: TIGR02281 family clan AA aspartic protease [Gammaproteobacteria bacterium]|nr:TIGR02281 family clan AA aspartic protease [Gammaproteobacteria bacterium]